MRLTPEILTRLRLAYEQGINLTELLKQEGFEMNSLAIEVIYDLQAGSYSRYVQDNSGKSNRFVSEVVSIIAPYILPGTSLLDAGTGEGTSVIPLVKALNIPIDAFAFDISWSRLSFASKNSRLFSTDISLAVANMVNIPMATSSIDTVLTIHAVEPNGGKEIEIVKELARVAKKYVILIEPDFDSASNQQKTRMKRLSYIGSLQDAINASNLTTVEKIPLRNNSNPLNCASVYILKTDVKKEKSLESARWVDPIFNTQLTNFEGGLRNSEGLWYPVLRKIPFLRKEDAKFVLNPESSEGEC